MIFRSFFECADSDCISHFGAELFRARHEQLVKKTSFNGNLAFIASRKIDTYSLAADGDEFDGTEFAVRQGTDAFEDFQPAEDWPAGRI